MRSQVAAVAGGAAVWSLPALAPLVPALSGALGVPTRIAAAGAVALTFDDGPHPEGTPAVLDVLAATGVVATFFMVGEQVLRDRGLAAEVVARGHAVAVHGHRHRNLLRLPPSAIADDLDRAASVIADATGVVPALHRPPYGIYSWPGLRAVRARGWMPLLWSRWGRDWTPDATPHEIADRVTRDVRAGDILLLHDADDYSAPGSHRRTVAALPRALDAVQAAGLGCVTVPHPSGR